MIIRRLITPREFKPIERSVFLLLDERVSIPREIFSSFPTNGGRIALSEVELEENALARNDIAYIPSRRIEATRHASGSTRNVPRTKAGVSSAPRLKGARPEIVSFSHVLLSAREGRALLALEGERPRVTPRKPPSTPAIMVLRRSD